MLDGAGPLLFPLCGTCDLEDLAPILISKKIDRCGRIKVFGESYRFAVDAVHNERFQTIGDPTGEFPCKARRAAWPNLFSDLGFVQTGAARRLPISAPAEYGT